MREALILSLSLSFLTAFLLTVSSVVVGFLLTFFRIPFKNFLLSLFMLPILLPPTVLGFYLLYLLNPSSPLGRIYKEITGSSLIFSFEGLMIASFIYSLPFGIFPVKDAFERINKRYIEIAFVFGYSRFKTFTKVILPNSTNGIFTAFLLIFARTMGEFGAVLMVGGNIPGETQTLSIYIYDQVQSLNYDEASRASMLLVAVAVITLTLILYLERAWKRY